MTHYLCTSCIVTIGGGGLSMMNKCLRCKISCPDELCKECSFHFNECINCGNNIYNID